MSLKDLLPISFNGFTKPLLQIDLCFGECSAIRNVSACGDR